MLDVVNVAMQLYTGNIMDRQSIISEIKRRLSEAGLSIIDAIRERELYFRISVTSACNLCCKFCHNEGGPKTGSIDPEIAEEAIIAAVSIGFKRVQFTGGEPLLHRDISNFVEVARSHTDDVGITTNGIYLLNVLEQLIDVGITRIHVSLQTESLIDAGSERTWGIPDWLAPTIQRANTGAFTLRLNLPVPANNLIEAEEFLHLLEDHRCDIKAFSVLPEGNIDNFSYPVDELAALIMRVNERRKDDPFSGEVIMRGFRSPVGVRCPNCKDNERCMEQSHSLRLGADLILRPCLASRAWDIPFRVEPEYETLTEAALLALDY
jgi:GTP 3',8-cyclase